MTKVIMLAGGIGSGKAYVMSQMVQELKETGNSIHLISFADPIKQFVKKHYGYDKNGKFVANNNFILKNPGPILDECIHFLRKESMISDKIEIPTYEQCEDWFKVFEYADKEFKKLKDKDNVEKIKIILRYIMQQLGTDIGHSFSKCIWARVAINKILKLNVDYVIIDDWRFMFELNFAIEVFQHTKFELIPYFIHADEEVRAKRRNITVKELNKQSQHISEREGQEVILPFMKLHYPDNIILNN
jgi:hypothetical protein